MAIRSGLFDSVAGDKPYSAAFFSYFIGKMMSTGVVQEFSNGLRVIEASPQSLNVYVTLGAAFLSGYYFEVFGENVTVPISAAPVAGSRIDRIIVSLDTSARTINVIARTGVSVPTGTPVAPVLTTAGNIYEISLAQVRVYAGNTTIAQSLITDERGTPSICPWTFPGGLYSHKIVSPLDHIDGSVTDEKIGTRTLNQLIGPQNGGIWSSSDSTGTITALLSRFASHLRWIRSPGGGNNWYDLNVLGLDQLVTHAGRHAVGGADPITPAAIGAASTAGDTFIGDVTFLTKALMTTLKFYTSTPTPPTASDYGIRLDASGTVDIVATQVRVVLPNVSAYNSYALVDDRLNLPNIPYMRVRRAGAAAQLIGAGANNVIAWNVTDVNIGGGGFSSNAYYVPVAGYYEVHAFVVIMQAVGNNSTARLILFVNGVYVETLDFAPFNTNADTGVSGSSVRGYNLNDYIQIVVQPTVTNTYIGTSDSKFTVRKVG